MATGDVYKIVTGFSYLGTVAMNRYYYKQISVGNDALAEEVKDAWIADVWPAVKAIMNDQVLLVDVEVINLMNPLDFHKSLLTGQTGDRTGEGMPPFVAWQYTLERDNRNFRPGRKSFVGVSEGDTANGEADATFISTLDAVSIALEDLITVPVSGATIRHILAREIVGLPPAETAVITNVAYRSVSTQNTRKFGRGV